MIYNEVLSTRKTPSGNANRHIFCAAGNNKKVSKRRNRATGRRATLPPGGSAGFGYVSRMGGQNVGQAVDPHFDPHFFQHFYNKKAPKTEVFDAFWSCWADSNRRPHPYQGCALPTELQQHNVATKKGLEPSTSSVTGWRSNQLNYLAIYAFVLKLKLAYYSKNVPECQHPFYIFRKRWRGDFLHN